MKKAQILNEITDVSRFQNNQCLNDIRTVCVCVCVCIAALNRILRID